MLKVALEVIAGNALRAFNEDGLEFATGAILLVRPTQLCNFHVLHQVIP